MKFSTLIISAVAVGVMAAPVVASEGNTLDTIKKRANSKNVVIRRMLGVEGNIRDADSYD